jgi:predicted transcriptional regulator
MDEIARRIDRTKNWIVRQAVLEQRKRNAVRLDRPIDLSRRLARRLLDELT